MHHPMPVMSPTSQMKRKQNAKMERDNIKRKLRSYEHTELPLDTDQDSDMNGIVSVIEKECASDLEKLFAEGDKHGVGNVDKRMERNESNREFIFSNILINILLETGKRSNNWSFITIRMGMNTKTWQTV